MNLRLISVLSIALTMVTAQQSTTIQTRAPAIPRRVDPTGADPTFTFTATAEVVDRGITGSALHPTITTATATPGQQGPVQTCFPTIAPGLDGYVPPGECNSLYNYFPSFSAALAATAVFGALSIVQIGQAFFYKQWFCWVIIMGVLWEAGAYSARMLGTKDQQSIGDLLTFQILVLLAPLWVNAFDYMVLGRMIQHFVPDHSIFGIRASTLSIYFVLLDIVSFIIQVYGTTMTGPGPAATILKGTHIYMGGIGIQEFWILVFLCFGIKFHRTMLQLEGADQLPLDKQNWRRLLYTIYASLGFITIRIIFRLVEFSGGETSTNPLPFHEAYFYVFDAIPMSCAITLMCITHPGSILPRIDRAEKKALQAAKKAKDKALKADKLREKMRQKGKGKNGYMEMLTEQEVEAGMQH